jgi:hypothetical protein
VETLELLTDTFFIRYQAMKIFDAYTERERRFLGQAASLLTEEVFVRNKARYKEAVNDPFYRGLDATHKKLSRELGLKWLIEPWFVYRWTGPNGQDLSQNRNRSMDGKTVLWLTQKPGENSLPDLFIKFRISFIEIALQEKEAWFASRKSNLVMLYGGVTTYENIENLGSDSQRKEREEIERNVAAFSRQVHELNERLRQAKMPISFHNGLMQISDDSLIEERIERPFWSIVSAPKWSVVDQQIKEAIDERDGGDRNAVSNALNALESTIKIISDEKGWTKGTEKGAASYIDNLVKEREGVRFIEVWEKDALVKLFGDIRNLFNHGPSGDKPVPTLRPEQTNWALDVCMVWIKSLIRRM